MTASEAAIATIIIITTTKFNELATTSSQRAPAASQGKQRCPLPLWLQPCARLRQVESFFVLQSKLLMGSTGWCECYWCPYWMHNAYILDGIGRPLCDWCLDWLFSHDGDPYEPTARRRAARVLQRWWGPRHHVNEQVCVEIASFLIERHVP